MTATHPTQSRRAPTGAVTAWVAAVMAAIGLIGPSWGPALVPARAAFHLNLLTAGTLFLTFGAARTVGAMLSALLSDVVGRPTLVAVYGAALVLGLSTVAVAPGWPAILVGAAVIGFAFGAVSTEANAVAALAGGAQRARNLSLVNAVYSIGAAVGPLVVGGLLQAHLGWRLAFGLWATLCVVPFAGLARSVVGLGPAPGARSAGPGLRLTAGLLFLPAMAFIYNGIGWTVGGWAATYLVGRFGATLLAGTLGSTFFYALLTAGRLVNRRFASHASAATLLRIGAVGSAISLLGLALAPTAVWSLVAFGAAGFCLAGIYPNLVAHAAGLQPDRPGAMAGLVATGGAIGVTVVPFLAGALGHLAGLAAMTWMLLGLGIALVALAEAGARRRPGHGTVGPAAPGQAS